MKFVSLRTKRTHRRGHLDKRAGAKLESFTKPMAAPHRIRSYAELRQQIHDDLRIQHPEWVQANGECPMCNSLRGAPYGTACYIHANGMQRSLSLIFIAHGNWDLERKQ